MSTPTVLGVAVDAITAPELLVAVRHGMQQGQRQWIVTVNAEMAVRADRDHRFAALLKRATWRVPDGIGIVWAAHYLSKPLRGPLRGVRYYLQALRHLVWLALWPRRVKTVLPETVPGSDLAIDLAGMCEEFGYRLYLLGAAPGVAEAAAETLRKRFPRLEVVGAEAGTPRASGDEAVLKRIKAAKADVLLVAYGVPKQEHWIARNLPKLRKPITVVGIGGTLDYLAGAAPVEGGRPAKQPPVSVRKRGFEWLWRLMTQPRRIGRVITAVPVFVNRVIRHKRSTS